jgi:short-subunit dehydrogenase
VRVALITGASSGIGRALASAAARRGISAVLSGRDEAALAEVAREAEAHGRQRGKSVRMVTVAGDVTDEAHRQALVVAAEREFGRLDLLVNNAGRGYYVRIRDVDPAELAGLFALNVLAPLRLTQLALPALAATRGTVVMVSSIAGVLAAPTMGAYAASKFALEAVAMALRSEVAAEGIRVLVVRPGPVETPFRANAVGGTGRGSDGRDAGVRPVGSRPQTAEDVAERVFRAESRGNAVLETSMFVRVASFGARSVPGLVRRMTARMAARKAS